VLAAALGMGFALCNGLISLSLLKYLHPQSLTGDEFEYARARHGVQWVRVPLFRAFFAAVDLIPGAKNVAGFRRANILLSAVTTGIAVACAATLGGTGAGLITGVLLLLMLERSFFAIHLWPESLLGLLFLLCIMVMVHTPEPDGWVVGAVISLAFLTRVEFAALIVVPVIASLMGQAWGWADVWQVISVFAVVFAAVSVRNGLKHGIWFPDTTALYNIRVFSLEIAMPAEPIGILMRTAAQGGAPAETQTAAQWFSIPMGILRRFNTFFGRETFILQSLLQTNRTGYDLAARAVVRRRLHLPLKFGFALLFATALALAPVMPLLFWVSFCTVVAVSILVQTRSRYRISFIPALCFEVGLAAYNLTPAVLAEVWPMSVALVLGFLVLLKLAPSRAET